MLRQVGGTTPGTVVIEIGQGGNDAIAHFCCFIDTTPILQLHKLQICYTFAQNKNVSFFQLTFCRVNIMKSAVLTFAAIGLLAAAAASAEISGSITATGISDYDFRGVSQTANDPAVQGSLDLESDSGWYLGVWGSNVDFGDGESADLELDWYAGMTFGEIWQSDFGAVLYKYPDNSDLDYTEFYGGVTYAGAENWDAGFKQWYSYNWFGFENTNGYYSEVNGSYTLPWFGIGLTAHFGYTWGDGPDEFYDEYTDWSFGLTKSWWEDRIETAVRYVDTDLDDDFEGLNGAGEKDGRVIGSISITLP